MMNEEEKKDMIPFLRESEKMKDNPSVVPEGFAMISRRDETETQSRKAVDLMVAKFLQDDLQYSIESNCHSVEAIVGKEKSPQNRMTLLFEFNGMKLMFDLIKSMFGRELDHMGLSISFLNTTHNENIIVISKTFNPIDGAYYETRKPKVKSNIED